MSTMENSENWQETEAPVPAVPAHVGIIMDGNGRWAAARGLRRQAGHRQGMESARNAIRHAHNRGISYLTLFSFSSENWSRPYQEISELMRLLQVFIRRDLKELDRGNVKVRIIGSRKGVDAHTLRLLDEAQEKTSDNSGLVLTIAFNYGARDEIARAARRLARKVESGKLKADEITQEVFENHLDTRGLPHPDLLIRTSGEQRLSNFLLWQCAYSELVFVDAFWPDFTSEVFEKALNEYQNRERRFGGLQAG